MVECDLFKSISQILRQREVLKIAATEYIHHTTQPYEFDININKVREYMSSVNMQAT